MTDRARVTRQRRIIQDRMGQILGIVAAALNVVSMGISGREGPSQ